MPRLANTLEHFEDKDELVNDRLPGMPLLGFLTGTVLSLMLWAAMAVLAWAA